MMSNSSWPEWLMLGLFSGTILHIRTTLILLLITTLYLNAPLPPPWGGGRPRDRLLQFLPGTVAPPSVSWWPWTTAPPVVSSPEGPYVEGLWFTGGLLLGQFIGVLPMIGLLSASLLIFDRPLPSFFGLSAHTYRQLLGL